MKKMTKEDVKEMLRKIIEFEINRAMKKIVKDMANKDCGTVGNDLRGQMLLEINDLKEDTELIDEERAREIVIEELDDSDYIDADDVRSLARDEIHNFDFEDDMRKIEDRLDKQKYDYEKKIAMINKKINAIKKGV